MVPPAELELADVDVERHVAHQRDDGGVGTGEVLVVRQVLAQLGRLLVQVGEDPIEVAVFEQNFAAVFSPTPGTPGRLSEGSPRRAARSTYFDGGTPVRSTMPASS